MQLSLDYPDLPSYRVRVSPRAKRASVTVCLHEGIVVTLPKRFSQRCVPALLKEWQPWLQQRLRELQRERDTLPAENTQSVPDRINLLGGAKRYQVTRETGKPQPVQVRETAGQLLLRGNTGDEQQCRAALQRWLARSAKRHLEPLTDSLANQYQFAYKRISIRGQRTLWGSCSTTGTISLNYYLMFQKPKLVRCVVIHELCHTRHMNHGKRFHALMKQLLPDYQQLDAELNSAWRWIPRWAWLR